MVVIIIAFIGTVGSGKTLSCTYQAYLYYKQGFTIYANYGLLFPHVKLTKEVFLKLIADPKGLQNAVLCLDEVHIWMDSRSSMMKKNKVVGYFILQTRKRNVRLLCTTQHLHQIDKRLRDTVDILVFCRNITNKSSLVSDASIRTLISQEYFYQWKDGAKPKVKVIHANPIYSLYDTTEMVSFLEDDVDTSQQKLG